MQRAAKDRWENEGGKPAAERTQTTREGLGIPVPKRNEVMDAVKKVAQPVKKSKK